MRNVTVCLDASYSNIHSLIFFAEEIQTLRRNLKEARHEHQSLEDKVRELRSSETTMTVSLICDVTPPFHWLI
jgi:hypothetical protein